jgi:UDP-4-keto-D-QuiNAc 4-reductase
VWNLCDVLVELLSNPAAPGCAWLVSDGEDISTPELIRRIALGMGRHPRLLPAPRAVLRAIGHLTRREDLFTTLCGSLQVSLDETRGKLGWSPPVAMSEGLARTTRWYLSWVNQSAA